MNSMAERRRYAQVGLGIRGEEYLRSLATTFADRCELVGICDRNAGRVQLQGRRLAALGCTPQGYLDGDFERMIAETRPDCVLVASMDASHACYCIRAMELGCDVLTEKPMAIDVEGCRRLLEAQRRTGRRCQVVFNARYSPGSAQVKGLLMDGAVGEVLSVDFHEMLDTVHGADYFRRWHRQRENSSGLLLHKATHHFDLVDWMLSAMPVSVSAIGRRAFYRPETAAQYGLAAPGTHCRACSETARCPFFFDMLADDNLREMYAETEQHDGYLRDRCPFSAEIDIEDAISLNVRYDTGAVMSYSLVAFSPVEGFSLAFNGAKGRLEYSHRPKMPEEYRIRLYPHFTAGPPQEIPVVREAEGGHDGADTLLYRDLLAPDGRPDRFLRVADQRAGACSILTGLAANASMASGQEMRIADLAPDLERPDFPPMPVLARM